MGKEMGDHFHLIFTDNKDTVYYEYQKQKTFFRLLCNKLHFDQNSENLLDRHKVCAAICVSVMKASLLVCDEEIKDSTHDIADFKKYNEQLAAAVSLELLKSFIIAESKINKKKNPFEDHKSFIFPTPQNENETYEDTIVRALFFANTVGQSSLHLIAHILFLIEQYHILSLNSQ